MSAMRSAALAGLRVLVATALLGDGSLAAEPEGAQAEVLFRQGKELMAAGKLAQACAAFDASQKLDPTLPTLLNQANCRQQNGQLATAWGLFLEAERRTRGGADRASQQMHATAASRAASLEPRLSTLRIDVPDASRIRGLEIRRNDEIVDPAAWLQALPVDGGSYRISARAPGATEWSTAVVIASERDAKTIEIPRLDDATRRPIASAPVDRAAPTHAPGQVAPLEPTQQEPPPPATSSPWSRRRKLAVVVSAGAVAALGAGGVLGELAQRRQRDANTLCPDPDRACENADPANDRSRAAHRFATTANVAFGVAAGAAITAGVLWITGAPESRRGLTVVPAASPGELVVVASGSFW